MKNPDGEPAPRPRLVVFDVRAQVARGEHPLAEVLALVDLLDTGGVIEVLAPFQPVPMMQRLRSLGCEVVSEQRGSLWILRAGKGALPPVADLSELPPPEPMEQALEALVGLQPGQVYLALLPRSPQLLLPHLARQGLAFAVAERPDQTALLWVRR